MMFGMAALILVLAMLCGAVLVRSLEAYRASASLQWRLQAAAAAEGAAIILRRAPASLIQPTAPSRPLQIGSCRVHPRALSDRANTGAATAATTVSTISATTGSAASSTLALRVEVLQGERIAYQCDYEAHYTQPESTSPLRLLTRLERAS